MLKVGNFPNKLQIQALLYKKLRFLYLADSVELVNGRMCKPTRHMLTMSVHLECYLVILNLNVTLDYHPITDIHLITLRMMLITITITNMNRHQVG